ncbi:cytochrome C biogenesis protein transmembrane region [Isoalcanivorax pacificus W11-5]|uniref:Cytochrome C biogenesis protein transmembrane region n=1 Tax=Isoalcanivorax pacificus W11-5 TaxID=391936 RepID=A0A0B4XPR7_9GAMM|nr:protein-disulfide reductase DsbD [Isoalcanivorax pacificus]AJD49196.1 cytochrome C biogenesis protein transmembrane region [Isoalcanivorax pacificus W11-5]
MTILQRSFFRSLALPLILLVCATPALALFGESGNASLFGGNNHELPTPEQAIHVDALPNVDAEAIDLIFEIIDQVYLYQHAFSFRLTDTHGNLLDDFSDFTVPDGKLKHDELFGEVQVYYGQLALRLPLDAIPLTDTVLEVNYQGCIEDTLCYPPQTSSFPLTFVSAEQMSFGAPAPEPVAAPAAPAPTASDDNGFFSTLSSQDANAFSRWLGSHSLGMVLLLFYVGGLLLALTPCVFPMIPILSGIIAGQAEPTARRGFLLSSAYVLGMAVPYTLAGLLVALFGAGLNLQFWLQQPAAIIISAVIFLLLALGMFGVFTLQLPAFLRDRLNAASERRQGGSLGGAALIGAISGLIVSPCVTPILAGALIYVASSGEAVTGALTLFTLALGMGTPLIIFGTGGSHLLPRAGEWMDDIKRFFGVVMLGVAIWLLGRIVSPSLTLGLYGVLLAVYGVQLGALDASGHRLRRGIALVLALYGAIMVIGAAGGGTDPWQPLAHRQAPATAHVASPGEASTGVYGFVDVSGQQALADTLRQAQADNRPVLVDFFAEWCVACKVLEETTLSDAAVLSAMQAQNMLLVRADITDIDRENQAIMAEYGIFGLPSLVFMARDGGEIPESRILGEMSAERFLSHLNTRVFPSI